MKTLELKKNDGGIKSYDILQDGYVVYSWKNAHGMIVKLGKVVTTTGYVGDVKFMSDCFVVERDLDDLDEIIDMLKFEGLPVSLAGDLNDYMKYLEEETPVAIVIGMTEEGKPDSLSVWAADSICLYSSYDLDSNECKKWLSKIEFEEGKKYYRI